MYRRPGYRRMVWIAIVPLVVLLPACGGGSDSKDAGPACPPAAATRAATDGAVTICAYDIKFDTKEITAPAGPLTITLANKGSLPHNFTIEGKNFVLSTPKKGASKTETIDLAPGEYKYVCTIDGHQAAMNGKIVVS